MTQKEMRNKHKKYEKKFKTEYFYDIKVKCK